MKQDLLLCSKWTYRLWHHQHRFQARPGGAERTDIVHDALPWGLFGEPAHRIVDRRKLARIFDYRRSRLAEIFTGPSH